MEYKQVLIKKKDKIGTLLLNQPDKLNTLDEEMVEELTRACLELGEDDDLRCIILTGAGRAFSAGADRKSALFEMDSPTRFWEFMQKASKMVLAIRSIPQPVIAAVNGPAVGGGCNIALACDMIIASEAASFCEIYILMGIHPDAGGTFFLPRLVGLPKALELMLTGKTIDAQEAYRIGLVNEITAPDQLEDRAREMASTLVQRAPLAVRMIKASIYQGLQTDLPTALEQEAKALSMLLFTEDHKEALASSVGKREPVFTGK